MPFDRHRELAVEPAAGASRARVRARERHRRVRPADEPASVVAGADLDPDVGPVKLREDVLVGDVVAEIEDGARRRLHRAAQSTAAPLSVDISESSTTSLPFVTCTSGHVAGPRADSLQSTVGRPAARRLARARHARRLDLETDAVVLAARSAVSSVSSRAWSSTELRREPVDEPDVELGTVTADEMDLARQAREGRRGRATSDRTRRRPSSAATRRERERRRPPRSAARPSQGRRRSARACRRSRSRSAAAGTRAMRPSAARSSGSSSDSAVRGRPRARQPTGLRCAQVGEERAGPAIHVVVAQMPLHDLHPAASVRVGRRRLRAQARP